MLEEVPAAAEMSRDEPNDDIPHSAQPVVAEEHQLHRALGPVSLIMIGIGSIIGAGIFVIAGTAAAEHAGPAVLISFVIAGTGLPVRRSLLCRIRVDDSGIGQRLHLCLRHHGPLHGVVHRLEHGARISACRRPTVAVGWSGYFVSFLQNFGTAFPAAFANAPVGGHRHSTSCI